MATHICFTTIFLRFLLCLNCNQNVHFSAKKAPALYNKHFLDSFFPKHVQERTTFHDNAILYGSLKERLNRVMNKYQHPLHIHEPTNGGLIHQVHCWIIYGLAIQNIYSSQVLWNQASVITIWFMQSTGIRPTINKVINNTWLYNIGLLRSFDQDAYEIDLQSADWSTLYNAQTTDEAWDNLHSILIKTVNKYAPLKERRIQA